MLILTLRPQSLQSGVHILTVVLLVWWSTADKFLPSAFTTTVRLLPKTPAFYFKDPVALNTVVNVALLLLLLRRYPAPLGIALLTFATETDIPPARPF
jgi:hypothetical protein